MRYIQLMVAIPLLLISSGCWAVSKNPILNTVKLQLSEEAWVNTKTAKLVIAIDASLEQSQLANIQSQILVNLKNIAQAAQWHLTQFNRTKDQSNLERLQVLAEARLPEAELALVSKRVEAVSKPGAAYRIAAIEFTPSMADIEKVRAQLRAKVYEQVKQELSQLNTVYPEAHYFVHEINFKENLGAATPGSGMLLVASRYASKSNNEAAGLQVSNQLQLEAEVILAAQTKNH